MDLSTAKRIDRFNKSGRSYKKDTGNSNKYGKRVSTYGNRILPNGSVVVSVTGVPKTSRKLSHSARKAVEKEER